VRGWAKSRGSLAEKQIYNGLDFTGVPAPYQNYDRNWSRALSFLEYRYRYRYLVCVSVFGVEKCSVADTDFVGSGPFWSDPDLFVRIRI
jgi:hypothetical protein